MNCVTESFTMEGSGLSSERASKMMSSPLIRATATPSSLSESCDARASFSLAESSEQSTRITEACGHQSVIHVLSKRRWRWSQRPELLGERLGNRPESLELAEEPLEESAALR